MQNPERIIGMIDHTLLKPQATESQIVALCEEALEYNFAAACVNSVYATRCQPRSQGQRCQRLLCRWFSTWCERYHR